jgi:YggT family protein
MFVLGNLIEGLGVLLNVLLNLYMLAIVVYALMSWIEPNPYNPVVRFLTNLCEPALGVVRNILPRGLGIDISPIVVIAIIYLTKRVIADSLLQMGHQLR